MKAGLSHTLAGPIGILMTGVNRILIYSRHNDPGTPIHLCLLQGLRYHGRGSSETLNAYWILTGSFS